MAGYLWRMSRILIACIYSVLCHGKKTHFEPRHPASTVTVCVIFLFFGGRGQNLNSNITACTATSGPTFACMYTQNHEEIHLVTATPMSMNTLTAFCITTPPRTLTANNSRIVAMRTTNSVSTTSSLLVTLPVSDPVTWPMRSYPLIRSTTPTEQLRAQSPS